ncbi:MAG: redoxin domain-containing protein [Planctomycetota bacterium]|nr:redoxin domain-containing protein [Planctomycetota bacterium]
MTSRRKQCRFSQAALLTAAALVAMLAVGCQSAENAPPSPAPTSPAPAAVSPTTNQGPAAATPGAAAVDASKLLDETRLPDLDGTVRSLRDRMGPKGLLVVFVDTNCPFSATAIREMSSVASVLAKYDIPSLLLNVGEPQATVERFYAQRQVGIPVIYDTGRAALKAWAVT